MTWSLSVSRANSSGTGTALTVTIAAIPMFIVTSAKMTVECDGAGFGRLAVPHYAGYNPFAALAAFWRAL